MKKVCGIGINDYDGKVNIDGVLIKSYVVWRDMLSRCYSKRDIVRHPTYADVNVCDEWLSFSKFKEWFDKNYPYNLDKAGIKVQIDKDLLSNNDKIYSPDTCVFLPSRINKFISSENSNNKSGYTGVYWDKYKKKWRVRINEFDSGTYKHIGYFKDINDANIAYISAKKHETLKAKKYLEELEYDKDIIDKLEEL